jgi:hypothetical protein
MIAADIAAHQFRIFQLPAAAPAVIAKALRPWESCSRRSAL